MNNFPDPINLHSKLKPMLWHYRAGLDGVIYHASSVDDYHVCNSRIYIRYDVDAPTDREADLLHLTLTSNPPIPKNECYALVQFPGGNVISKKVESFDHGILWCESRREIFWNELWRTITEEIFVEK